MSSEQTDTKNSKTGGFAYFISIPALLLIGVVNFFTLISSWSLEDTSSFFSFIGASLLGFLFSYIFLRRRIGVLIHELKHSILAGLVGNKWKKMEVEDRSGSFEYAYSKDTAKYNAFISLAPYWLPLFTLIGMLLGYATCYPNHSLIVVCVGLGYGSDLFLGVRDISPHQTDFSQLRGGYRLGLIYIIAIQIVVATLTVLWVMHSSDTISILANGWWNLLKELLGV